MFNRIKNMIKPVIPEMPRIRDCTLADRAYEVISKQIQKYQESLNNDEEVGVMLTSFGQSIVMSVTSIGYQNPNLLYFFGYVNEVESQLIQHISQLNFLLTSIKVKDNRTPNRIGF